MLFDDGNKRIVCKGVMKTGCVQRLDRMETINPGRNSLLRKKVCRTDNFAHDRTCRNKAYVTAFADTSRLTKTNLRDRI